MKHDVQNLAGPTFVHAIDGTKMIAEGETITAEFDDNELAAIKANKSLKVSANKDEPKK